MTRTAPKRKPFRREMWAVLFKDGNTSASFWNSQRLAKKDAAGWCEPSCVICVLVTELPRKGRDGK